MTNIILFLIFSLQSFCALQPVYVRKCKNHINNEISSTLPSIEAIEFKAHCPEACTGLRHEIIALAKRQLRLGGSTSFFDFDNYEIENWPEFVPSCIRLWDKKAYDDLRSALPSLIFKPKSPVITKRSGNTKVFIPNRMINRSKLSVKLLESFNEQTNSRSQIIKWLSYHIINWPVGVSLHVNHFSAIEVLTVYRHLDRIRFVKVAKGETRTVTYTDGTVVNASELKNRKSKRKLKRKRAEKDESETETEAEAEEYETSSNYKVNDNAKQTSENTNIQIPANIFNNEFYDPEFDEIINIFNEPIEDNEGTMINFDTLRQYDPDSVLRMANNEPIYPYSENLRELEDFHV